MDFASYLVDFAIMFYLMAPGSGLPAFVALTERKEERERRKTIGWLTLFSLVLLGIIGWLASFIIENEAVERGFYLVGGLVLVLVGVRILATRSRRHILVWKTTSNISVALCMLPAYVGPCVLITVIALLSKASDPREQLFVYISVLVALLAVDVCLFYSRRIFRWFGDKVTTWGIVLNGLVLMGLGAWFIWRGVFESV